MDISKFIGGGKLLSAKVVKDDMIEGKHLTIEGVRVQAFEEREKLALSFDEIDYDMVLNATNTKILAAEFGHESDRWIGKKILLLLSKTNFQGSLVDTVVIKPVKEAGA
jgi:hypothetical protein